MSEKLLCVCLIEWVIKDNSKGLIELGWEWITNGVSEWEGEN